MTKSLTELLALGDPNKDFVAAVSQTLNNETAAQVNARLKSKAYKPANASTDMFSITIDGTKVTVTLKCNSGVTGATDFVIN